MTTTLFLAVRISSFRTAIACLQIISSHPCSSFIILLTFHHLFCKDCSTSACDASLTLLSIRDVFLGFCRFGQTLRVITFESGVTSQAFSKALVCIVSSFNVHSYIFCKPSSIPAGQGRQTSELGSSIGQTRPWRGLFTMRGMLLAGIALSYLASVVQATPYQATFTSCLSSYNAAGTDDQMVVSAVYANLVGGREAVEQGLIGGGNDVLRVDVIGETGNDVQGYNNATNKLGTSEKSVLSSTCNVARRRGLQ